MRLPGTNLDLDLDLLHGGHVDFGKLNVHQLVVRRQETWITLGLAFLFLLACFCLFSNLGQGSLFNNDDAIYGSLIWRLHHSPHSIFAQLGWRQPL